MVLPINIQEELVNTIVKYKAKPHKTDKNILHSHIAGSITYGKNFLLFTGSK